MEINFESILKTFRAESGEHLRNMEECIIALESNPDDQEALRTIFRIAHTIKGSSSCLGLQGVTEFSHELESILELMRKRQIATDPSLFSLLLKSVDALKEMTSVAAIGDDELNPRHRGVMNLLIGEAHRAQLAAGSSVEDGLTAGPPDRPRTADESHLSGDPTKTLRVDIEKLDGLELLSKVRSYLGE